LALGDFDVVEGPGAIPPEECAHFTKLICYLSGHGDTWKDIEASFGSSYAGDGITLHRDTRYFLDWLAYSFAQPDTPIGVAVAMRGRKGIGK
ncbi:hypothetical protein, partial [Escherichia coli]|uniref:hypothetical protein n=1 Tax=Escherichia coli TaxID=562 RepID=UPI00215A3DEB